MPSVRRDSPTRRNIRHRATRDTRSPSRSSKPCNKATKRSSPFRSPSTRRWWRNLERRCRRVRSQTTGGMSSTRKMAVTHPDGRVLGRLWLQRRPASRRTMTTAKRAVMGALMTTTHRRLRRLRTKRLHVMGVTQIRPSKTAVLKTRCSVHIMGQSGWNR